MSSAFLSRTACTDCLRFRDNELSTSILVFGFPVNAELAGVSRLITRRLHYDEHSMYVCHSPEKLASASCTACCLPGPSGRGFASIDSPLFALFSQGVESDYQFPKLHWYLRSKLSSKLHWSAKLGKSSGSV